MRNIQKHPEPKSLTQHRCNINTDYDNYAEKDELRLSLVSEQQGICCYISDKLRKLGVCQEGKENMSNSD